VKADQRAVRPASRFFVVPAAVLLIIPLIPFTVVSAWLSGAALIMALRERPGRARIISTVAAALLPAVTGHGDWLSRRHLRGRRDSDMLWRLTLREPERDRARQRNKTLEAPR
jgi:hypothetical protein